MPQVILENVSPDLLKRITQIAAARNQPLEETLLESLQQIYLGQESPVNRAFTGGPALGEPTITNEMTAPDDRLEPFPGEYVDAIEVPTPKLEFWFNEGGIAS